LYQREKLDWSLAESLSGLGERAQVMNDFDALVKAVSVTAQSGDQIVVMSNGDFGDIHDKLLRRLAH
jgi:UDP-N-acetylmuramate: L-alanyl-gamma-D-glutamyl-meso-diaminopimelate ligase